MPTKNARLEKLREEQKQLEAKIREIEAREKERERKDDQRRKMLAGTIILDAMVREPDSASAKAFHALLNRQVVKDSDRELFGLKAKPEPKAAEKEK